MPINPTPAVLIINFNRPKCSHQVLSAVIAAGVSRLYLACDGPREQYPYDEALVGETRSVLECLAGPLDSRAYEVKYYFSGTNLGCKYFPPSAIDWFFAHEEAGIILEDDTLPCNQFITYASELLDFYAADTRVMKISGFNPLASDPQVYPSDYIFTSRSFSWGWASWRRVWQKYSVEIPKWPVVKSQRLHLNYPFDPDRNHCYDQIIEGLNTWDYQLDFLINIENGLHVVPVCNMIRNIGFNSQATHTYTDPDGLSKIQFGDLGYIGAQPIRHPLTYLPNYEYEASLRKFHASQNASLLRRIRNRLKSINN